MDRSAVRGKWQGPAAGARYARARWSSERRRQRDPRRVAALLERHLAPGLAPGEPAWILDAPCGTGRLSAALAPHGRALGLDASPAMLAEARATAGPGALLVAGDVLRLPFRDASFEAVVCCRLLHHLEEDAAFERALGELVRVSRGLVIASFWDADSLPAWRRALFPGTRAPRRHARRRAAVAAALARAGAEVAGWSASLRFVSRQTFVVARKRTGA